MNYAGQEEREVDTTEARPSRILVVDDEQMMRDLLKQILTEDDHEVVTAATGREAMVLFWQGRIDLIISDIVMPGMDGIEVLQAAKNIDPDIPVILITGYPSTETAARVINLGAAEYITKPFNVDLLKLTVAKVLEQKNVDQGKDELKSPARVPGIHEITSAYNSVLFIDRLESELARSQRRGHVFSLLVAQIDNFGQYAGEPGASAADGLFETFDELLKQQISPGDILGRIGDAEFAVILPETTPVEANILGVEIRRGDASDLTVRVGVSCFPDDGSDAEGLLETARDRTRAAPSAAGDTVGDRNHAP
jgi:diguanylate cyclase (GGDEF)-like protein